MIFQPGVTTIEPSAMDEVAEAARRAGLLVFVLTTRGRVGREAFFDAVRSTLPQDPPIVGSRSWDALSDSVWEGMRTLGSSRAVILWPDATDFKENDSSEFETVVSVLADLASSLTDVEATNGKPKELAIFVGMTSTT